MNLFRATVRNVTLLARLESVHRFKTLLLSMKCLHRFRTREVVGPAARQESFSLRELRHDVFLVPFATLTALETSAVKGMGRTCKSAAVCALATLSKRLSGSTS